MLAVAQEIATLGTFVVAPSGSYPTITTLYALIGYPRNAGHFIASMIYRHGRLPLARPGQFIDLGSHRLKQVGKLPPEKPRGRR